jgi:hypothetical protein
LHAPSFCETESTTPGVRLSFHKVNGNQNVFCALPPGALRSDEGDYAIPL